MPSKSAPAGGRVHSRPLRQIWRRKAIIVIATMAFAGMAGTTAAHVVYSSGMVAQGSQRCAKVNKSEISHGTNNNGYSKDQMLGLNIGLTGGCTGTGIPAYQKSAGFYSVKQVGGSYAVCTSTYPFWVDDPETDSSHTVYAYGAAACGYGTYGTFGHARVINNGSWIGSSSGVVNSGIFSGWHSGLG